MKELMKAEELPAALAKLAKMIRERQNDFSKVAFVGIHTRGVPVAERLYKIFHDEAQAVSLGKLDINLYRDDLSESASQPILKSTELPFDVTGKIVYLCDDVLYTGRTIRAAMDAIFDLGRPSQLHLVVMARRNGRELPIDTDLVGLDVKTKAGDNVKVKFKETDGCDGITLLENGDY
jgi:pyrimidine operon attenuation protein/uracil phosphoribosyltransferase